MREPSPGQSRSTSNAEFARLDTLDFLVSAGVAIAIAFAGLYAGKDFGSGWDYLGALLIGLSGTLVIDWALLPWYRSRLARSTRSG